MRGHLWTLCFWGSSGTRQMECERQQQQQRVQERSAWNLQLQACEAFQLWAPCGSGLPGATEGEVMLHSITPLPVWVVSLTSQNVLVLFPTLRAQAYLRPFVCGVKKYLRFTCCCFSRIPCQNDDPLLYWVNLELPSNINEPYTCGFIAGVILPIWSSVCLSLGKLQPPSVAVAS